MTRLVPALAAVVLAGLVALAATAGGNVLAAALVVAVVVVATGWPGLLSLPTQRGSTTIIALCGAAAVAVATLTTDQPLLRWLPVVLAVSVIVAFWHQLLRRDMRPRLVESVTGVVAAVIVVELAAGWAAALKSPSGLDVVLVGVTGVAAAAAATALPWPQRLTGPMALVAAPASAALAGGFLSISSLAAALVGLGCAVIVVAFDRLLTPLPTATSRQAGLAIGAASVASSGVVVYLLGRVVG
ncbi:MAG TPA: hypothetical protein VFD41_06035 [Actinomycetales bacterium]|nr:hypothetical protein [Actinomycetales bacterium]